MSMVVVMEERATEAQIQAIVAQLTEMGFDVHRSTGATRTVIGAVGGGTGDPQLLAGNYRVSLVSPTAAPIVDQLMRPLQPAQFARDFGLKLTGSTLELTEISV